MDHKIIFLIFFMLFGVSEICPLDLSALLQEKHAIVKDDIKEIITKELLFSVLGKRFTLQETLSDKYKVLNWPGEDYFLAFDSDGKLINTGELLSDLKKDGALLLDMEFVFTMVMGNSYGYLQKNNISYLYNQFKQFVDVLLLYYKSSASNYDYSEKESIAIMTKVLKSWKKGKFNNKYDENITDKLMDFANDYNKLVKDLSNLYFIEKKKEAQIAAEKAAESKRKKRVLDRIETQYAYLGIPREMLATQLNTHSSPIVSDDLAMLGEFIDKVAGVKKWVGSGSFFLFYQETKDDITGEKHKIVWKFYDLRDIENCIWLDQVVVDNKIYPAEKIDYLVRQVLNK